MFDSITTLAALTGVTTIINILGAIALIKHYRHETAYARHLAKGDL